MIPDRGDGRGSVPTKEIPLLRLPVLHVHLHPFDFISKPSMPIWGNACLPTVSHVSSVLRGEDPLEFPLSVIPHLLRHSLFPHPT